MNMKSASAHLTLAIQYDPREDVLPVSYSRRANDRGSGTIDLQSLRSFGIEPSRLRGRVLMARTQPTAEYHVVSDRLYDMVFGGRGLVIDIAEVGEIERSEHRSGSPSPVQCPDKELLRGQMLAGGLWSDVVIEIVWASPRHAGTRESGAPYHWMILQSARLNMIPSNGSLFDLSPGGSSEYFDNYFSRCCNCEKRWWLLDTPVLGICPVCEVSTITRGLDVGQTLVATPHSPFVCADNDEDANPAMDVDASASEAPDYGDAPGVVSEASIVDLNEEPEVQSLLPTPPAQIWQVSTIMINPNFSSERNRESGLISLPLTSRELIRGVPTILTRSIALMRLGRTATEGYPMSQVTMT